MTKVRRNNKPISWIRYKYTYLEQDNKKGSEKRPNDLEIIEESVVRDKGVIVVMQQDEHDISSIHIDKREDDEVGSKIGSSGSERYD